MPFLPWSPMPRGAVPSIPRLPQSADLRRILVVAAHPDDETIGAGRAMARHVERGDGVLVAIVTNGRGPVAQPAEVERKSLLRRMAETQAALALLPIPERQILFLGFPDNEAHWHAAAIRRAVEYLLDRFAPDRVYTHSVEAGHLDHDVVGFLVQRVAARRNIPDIREWAEYSPAYPMDGPHLGFVDDPPGTVREDNLSPHERALKTAMLRQFVSQGVDRYYAAKPELIRPADPSSLKRRMETLYRSRPLSAPRRLALFRMLHGGY